MEDIVCKRVAGGKWKAVGRRCLVRVVEEVCLGLISQLFAFGMNRDGL
jgi:hypothetical protein